MSEGDRSAMFIVGRGGKPGRSTVEEIGDRDRHLICFLNREGAGWFTEGFSPQSRCLGDEELTVSKLPCFSFHACDDPICHCFGLWNGQGTAQIRSLWGEVGNAHEIRLSRETMPSRRTRTTDISSPSSRGGGSTAPLSPSLPLECNGTPNSSIGGRTNGRYVLSFKC